MSPGQIIANADERFEDVIPAIVVIEIRADSEERFEEIVPTVLTQEI